MNLPPAQPMRSMMAPPMGGPAPAMPKPPMDAPIPGEEMGEEAAPTSSQTITLGTQEIEAMGISGCQVGDVYTLDGQATVTSSDDQGVTLSISPNLQKQDESPEDAAKAGFNYEAGPFQA